MSRLIREVFAVAMTFLFVTHQKGVSINNQECKVRPEIINIKSNEPLLTNAHELVRVSWLRKLCEYV